MLALSGMPKCSLTCEPPEFDACWPVILWIEHQQVGGDAGDAGTMEIGSVGGPCSVAASTLVATPTGERPIGSLKIGDLVTAYNPTTGQSEAEPVQHVWINHDHDLVDVGLVGSAVAQGTSTTSASASAPSGAGTAPTGIASPKAPSQLNYMLRGVVALGAVALAVTQGSAALAAEATPTATTGASHTESVHTTANHPWLTSDRGWVEAGNLTPGETVVTLAGATETVAWVHAVAGQAAMYNLTVTQDHTYAVGNGGAVVHNTCGGGDVSSSAENDAAPSLLRPGGGGAKLPMSMDTVNSVADKYGIDLSENDIRINKAISGVRGSTAPNQTITLYRDAFENEEQLAITLVHEQYHVGQLQARMPYPSSYDAMSTWETEAENYAIAWWASLKGG